MLREQAGVLGPVASAPTVWRILDEVTGTRLKRIQAGRARTRRHVWALLGDGVPSSRVAGTDLGGGVVVLDVDATIVITHSEKENAAPTFKRTFGFHPLSVWCDNTQEFLAAKLRPGNGSNTAADRIEVLTDAIAQIPAAHRKHLLIRCDGAGASHQLLDWLSDQGRVRGRRVEYSVGFAVNAPVRDAISLLPDQAWSPASDADSGVRDGDDVAELTGLLDLTGWPGGMRVIVRRERPHPGAQLSLFEEADGWALPGVRHEHTRRPVGVPGGPPPGPRQGRGPDPSRQGFGPGTLPLQYGINQAWLMLAQIAADLTAWTRLLALSGDAAPLATCEPNALRYRLLHVPARLVQGGRRRHLRIPKSWPWVKAIVDAFAKIGAIPPPD